MRKNIRWKTTKTVALAATLGAALMFGGCGGSDAEETTTVAQTSVQESEEVTTEEVQQSETAEETTVEETTEKQTEKKKAEKTSMPTMEELYKEVASAAGLGDMYQIDSVDLSDSYGIETVQCKDYAVYQGSVAPSADTVALFKCYDSDGADDIAEKLQVLLDDLIATNDGYAPEEYAKASKAQVVKKGTFVYLIVCDNLSAAKKVIGKYE